MLSFVHDLLRVRRASTPLRLGDMRLIATDPRLLAYERRTGSERWLVVLNFSLDPVDLDPVTTAAGGRVIIGTHRGSGGSVIPTTVAPLEGRLLGGGQ